MSEPVRLLSPLYPDDWVAYHRIRRAVLFDGRERYGVYDPDRPDERKPGNYPKVLVLNGECVGVVRIDVVSDVAHLRRVAIDSPWQRKGLGRELIRLAEAFALEHGARRVESAVARDAVAFYEKCGYERVDPGDSAGSSVRMSKELSPGVAPSA